MTGLVDPDLAAAARRMLYAMCSLTYSKSPGWLSMPTRGGAIQPANLPGSQTGFISDWMKSPSAADGSHSSLRLCHSLSDRISPSGVTRAPAKTPIARWKPVWGSFSSNGIPILAIVVFQRSDPALARRGRSRPAAAC